MQQNILVIQEILIDALKHEVPGSNKAIEKLKEVSEHIIDKDHDIKQLEYILKGLLQGKGNE